VTGSKSSGSDRQEARAVDYVKTSQEAEATLDKRAAETKAEKASRRSDAADTDDSPKRQGDKLEHARDAAAGSGQRK
jgi:hypothetical protein